MYGFQLAINLLKFVATNSSQVLRAIENCLLLYASSLFNSIRFIAPQNGEIGGKNRLNQSQNRASSTYLHRTLNENGLQRLEIRGRNLRFTSDGRWRPIWRCFIQWKMWLKGIVNRFSINRKRICQHIKRSVFVLLCKWREFCEAGVVAAPGWTKLETQQSREFSQKPQNGCYKIDL